MRGTRPLVLVVCVLVSLLAAAAAAVAQPVRALVPVPFNDTPPTDVSVTIDRPELQIGSMVTVCYAVSRPGFMTLWNVSTAGTLARIYPNSFRPGDAGSAGAMRIEATARSCAGASGDPYRFRVDGPAGVEDLYLLWTTRPELQPPAASYRDAAAFANDLQRLDTAPRTDWASAKTTYAIMPAAAPAAAAPAQVVPTPTAALPPQSAAPGGRDMAPSAAVVPVRRGRTFVLAMGAQVDGLTKSNQDATVFTNAIIRRYGATQDNVRLIHEARKADFLAGMNWLRGRATADDLVFIYFSGHGGRVRDPTGTSDDGFDEFLVPYDFETARPPSAKDAVFSQEFARWINALPTDNVIAVIDTCHSAGVYRAIEAEVLGAQRKLYLMPRDADLTLPEGLAGEPRTRAAGGAGRVKAKGLLLAAAKRTQAALEDKREGSLFTNALVKAILEARSGTLAEAFERAAARTRAQTGDRQSPESVGTLAPARMIAFGP